MGESPTQAQTKKGKREEKEEESALGGLMRSGVTPDRILTMTQYRIKKPILTVYMPVFNAALYLSSAIESILTQTYSNFEFIIVDDASTDNSWKIIRSYARKDHRIRIFKNKINLGVSSTSNIAISYARGRFLARMDADDISLPTRFKKQLNFLQKNKNVIAVGGQCILINQYNQTIGYKNFPVNSHQLDRMIFWAVPIQQSTIMIDLRKVPTNFSWYDRVKTSAEEITLMFELLKLGQLANLPEVLVYYRQLPQSLSHINPKKTFFLTLQSRLQAIKNGYTPSPFAALINLAQILVVLLLPSEALYAIWYSVRNLKNLTFGSIFGSKSPIPQLNPLN